MGDVTAAALTTCQVSTDGEGVRLLYVDTNGQPGSLALSTESVSALIMTLPALASAALKAQHRDSSLRIVYTLGGFRVESAAGCQSSILTLTTPDGFEVAFSLPPDTVTALHAAIAPDASRAAALQ